MEVTEKKSWFWNFIEGLVPAAFLNVLTVGGSNLLKEHGPKIMKSFIGGLGTNDEALYLSAVSYAVVKKNVDVNDIAKIENVINAHPEIRARVIEIVGKDEQPITVEVPMEDKNGKPVMDKKTGQQKTTKTTINMNVRGGEALFVMSKMTPDQILVHLRTAGGFDSFGQNLKDFAKNPHVQNIVNQLKTQHESVDDWFVKHHYKGV